MPKQNKFKRGETAIWSCARCKRLTRNTGDNGQCELCPQCFDLAGIENAAIDSRTAAAHMTGNVLTAQCPECRSVHSGPHCPRPPSELAEVAQAVADFLAGPKDRLGRVDAAANDQVRSAREQIRRFAVHYNVTGSATYLDQCSAVLRAAVTRSRGNHGKS